MDFLLDPNIAYLILLAGVLLGFLAIITPGTGMFEVGAFFCLLLAGYAVYNLSFNWWALLLLVLKRVHRPDQQDDASAHVTPVMAVLFARH